MPNNYVLLPGFDVDKKELEKKKLDEAVGRVEEINDSITGKKIGFHCNEGSFPWFKTKVLNPLFNRFMTSANHFTPLMIVSGVNVVKGYVRLGTW